MRLTAGWSLKVHALAMGVVLLAGGTGKAADPATAPIDFTQDVRPILSNSCFQCHGPDEASREADLRLDTPDGATADLGGHLAVAPGDPAKSELLRRVTAGDPDELMPPPDSDYGRLTPEQVDILRRWIEQGAEYEQHWAFIAPERPELPEVKDSDWPQNEIDHFVLRRMREKGLAPNSEASKETLIRRVTLDLTGLPPTIEEIDAFLADDSPDAYEKVVDRLLQSPRYGEHMTRYWLDAARYGDTHGLHLDNMRSMWPYRDWLIRAFNSNRPFDQMTIEQLAGDLLPEATTDQKVASGFNRCHVTTSEGGSIAEEFYVRYTVDRVETVGTVFMGLTLGCAACHDHKFDPVSQKEFYQLFAYFNSLTDKPMDGNALLPPPVVEVPTPEQSEQRTNLQQQIAAVNSQLKEAIAAIEYTDPHADAESVELEPTEFVWIDDAVPSGAQPQQSGHPWEFVSAPEPVFSGEKATRRTAEEMGQHFFTGANPPLVIGDGDKLFASVYLDPENPPTEIMLQFNDGSWNHRAYWGKNAIDWGQDGKESRLPMGDLPPVGQWVRLEVDAAKVGLKPGMKLNGWAFTQWGGRVYWDRAGIVTRTPQNGQPFESQRLWELAIGEGKDLPKPVQDVLKIAPADRNEKQQETIRTYFLERVYPGTKEQVAPMLAEREQLQADLKALNDAIPKTLVSEEMKEPKTAYVLDRGEYDRKTDPVERQVPSVFPGLPEGVSNDRLGFARWLVDPSHPLMARVTVNRWWQRYFGTGIVKTSEDFGVQGDFPTHPELLDWLATELIRTGWDVKGMQKRIVMSAAYRQDSKVSDEALAIDPENRYLSRGPRFRLEAETIRDAALFVSGLLNEKVGGPSVKPYQPSGIWEAVGYTGSNTANFTQDDGQKLYRRSMYTFWKRTAPPPSMSNFDAPSRESCTVRRARTNTPMQALTLMNDKQFVEASRHFAQRILREGGTTDDDRLVFAFRLATSRMPEADELNVIRQLLQQQRTYFSGKPEAAKALIDSATTQLEPQHLERDHNRDPEVAAWTMLANLLLNLDETINKS
ncbi:PSD1 and planctomycete cytochrome C domain-containing protein [Maioricimonas sp. JC845]|uniref:PSD1 and planctomycete cytochrome C domain-containing protein n=1 Tax=Maioricimonas sp. JC845 TaxID=3232138 RepID=UPI003458ADD2